LPGSRTGGHRVLGLGRRVRRPQQPRVFDELDEHGVVRNDGLAAGRVTRRGRGRWRIVGWHLRDGGAFRLGRRRLLRFRLLGRFERRAAQRFVERQIRCPLFAGQRAHIDDRIRRDDGQAVAGQRDAQAFTLRFDIAAVLARHRCDWQGRRHEQQDDQRNE